MIRAVIDTNVYVAALLSSEGAPARVVRGLGEGLFDALVCPRLLNELGGVLTRPKIVQRVDPATSSAFMLWLERMAIVEPDPADIPSVSPDPNDDYLVALALIGRAQAIVSGDAHLLGLTGASPRVLSPTAFATLVEGLR